MNDSDRSALDRLTEESRLLIASSMRHLDLARAAVERAKEHIVSTNNWLRRQSTRTARRAARLYTHFNAY